MGKSCLDRISVWKGTLARVSLFFRKMGEETMSNLTKSALEASCIFLLVKLKKIEYNTDIIDYKLNRYSRSKYLI